MCGGGDLNQMECIVCNQHIKHHMIYILFLTSNVSTKGKKVFKTHSGKNRTIRMKTPLQALKNELVLSGVLSSFI